MHDSAWGRPIAALVSPVRTFESIARRPTWAVALVLLVAIGAVAAVLIWQRVDVAEMVREATAAQGQELTDAQIEQAAAIQEKAGFGCSLLAPPIAYLVAALVLMVAFNLVGGEIKFPTSLAVTVHAMMPWAVASLITLPVVLARDEIGYQQLKTGSVLASSAAALAPSDTGPVLLALLASFDLFTLWTIALLAVGFSIAAGVSRGKAALTVVVLWAVYVAGKVGLAGIGAAFGGGG